MESIQQHFQDKYPKLREKMILVATSDSLTIEIPFLNPRYSAWITKYKDDGYAVGINFLHNHFDLDTEEKNMKDAFADLDDILNDKVVAVGLRNKTEEYIRAVMPLDIGLSKYSNKKKEFEIVSFSKEY